MISSAHPLATDAGLQILRNGGNAFDAAVAVAAALNVVEPAMSGAGGYGTIMVYSAASRETWFLNSSGRIPASVNSDVFRAPSPDYLQNRRGAKSVSTPGNVHAWEAMSKRFGKMEWARLFAPAIQLASDGFVLDDRAADMFARGFEVIQGDAKAIFGRNGKALAAGERLVQADLGRSLSLIAKGGADVFYKGEIATAIDETMKKAGGFLSRHDLEADVAKWWKPISVRYRNVDVVTASPPANAFDYLVRLGIMSQFDTASLGHNSADYLHRFAEVTKHGFWVRLKYAGDPEVSPPPIDRLLSDAYWKDQAKAIDPSKASRFTPPGDSSGLEGHTTHFVVADGEGNVVSATQTLGGPFGSRIMAQGTGIWLNDSLEFSTFEPKGNPMDAHAGRHKLSGDCPTIVMRDGRPWVAIGTPGGHTIGQTVPQMVMNLIDFRMDVLQAISAPRISFAEPDDLLVEDRIPEAVRKDLEARGHKVRVVRALGNAHGLTIEYDPKGRVARLSGAADPRGVGKAAGY
jgi:gamma-glutamyltranspeptidase / glutathione hydrolase